MSRKEKLEKKKEEERPEAKWTRWALYFYNFCLFFVAILIFFCGIRFIFSMRNIRILDAEHVYFVTVGCFIIGCLILAAGVHACCGAFWQNRMVLYVFIGLMWLVLVLELALAIWLFYQLALMKEAIPVKLESLMKEYSISHDRTYDNLQYNYDCCGVVYHVDWLNTTWGSSHLGLVPGSCCQSTNAVCAVNSTSLSQQGCEEPVMNEIEFICSYVMTILLVSAFIQCIGISISYALTRLIKDYEVLGEYSS